MTLSCLVDKLLSNEDGGGIFDDPPAITESVVMPQDHGDDDDDFDALSGQFYAQICDCWKVFGNVETTT